MNDPSAIDAGDARPQPAAQRRSRDFSRFAARPAAASATAQAGAVRRGTARAGLAAPASFAEFGGPHLEQQARYSAGFAEGPEGAVATDPTFVHLLQHMALLQESLGATAARLGALINRTFGQCEVLPEPPEEPPPAGAVGEAFARLQALGRVAMLLEVRATELDQLA